MPNNKNYYLTLFFTVLNVAANILYNFMMVLLLDSLIAKDMNRLLQAIGINFLGIFFILATDAAMNVFQTKYISDEQLSMRRNQLLRLDRYEVSNLTSDMDLIENNFFNPYFRSIESGLKIAMALVALLWIDWRLALISLVLFGVIMLANMKLGPFSERMVEDYSKENETLIHRLTDLFHGRHVYQIFDFQQGFEEAHKPLFLQFRDAWLLLKHRTILIEQLGTLSSVIAQVVNLVVLAVLIFVGFIPLSYVLTARNLTGQLYNALASFPELRSKAKGGHALYQRLAEQNPAQNTEKPVLADTLTGVGLAKRYGEKTIFQNVDLTIRRGENVRIVGPSGSGKTTLLNVLFGAIPADEGEIQIDGKAVVPYRGVKNMAYITQNNYIFENTVRFNITLGDDFSAEEVERVAGLVGIPRFLNQEGLDMMLVEHGDNISGGERQRIALARALIRKKDVILVDETTANLDPKSAREIEDYLLNDPALTFIYVKHEENAAEDSRFDRFITLS